MILQVVDSQRVAPPLFSGGFLLTAGGKTGYFEDKLRGEFFFKKVLCKWLNRYEKT